MRVDLAGIACLAVLAAMTGGARDTKPRLRRYSQFCGPPHPKSRQHRRALEREAAKFRGETPMTTTPNQTAEELREDVQQAINDCRDADNAEMEELLHRVSAALQTPTDREGELLELLTICREWLEPDAVYTMATRTEVLACIDAHLSRSIVGEGE